MSLTINRFCRYEPRFEQPELLKADVAKSITLARILPKYLKVRLNDGPTAIFIMNMMSHGRILKQSRNSIAATL